MTHHYEEKLLSKLNFEEATINKLASSIAHIDAFNHNYKEASLVQWGVTESERIRTSKYLDTYIRSQNELKGYYKTLDDLLKRPLALSERTVKNIHRSLFEYVDGCNHAGDYKKHNVKVTVKPTKEIEYIINVTPYGEVDNEIKDLLNWTNQSLFLKELHPLITIGLFIYEFLAIHPFEDGNGRTSRVLTNLLLLKTGYSFVKYASIDKYIDSNRSLYINSLLSGHYYRGRGEEIINNWMIFFLNNIHRMIHQVVRHSDRQKKRGN